MAEEIKKGYDSLMAAYSKRKAEIEKSFERWGHTPANDNDFKHNDEKLQWVLSRAQKYADWCGATRDAVLEAWEKDRTYSWENYYQECNQPDPDKMQGTPVMLYADWKAKGTRIYGEDMMKWKFKCPNCGHVQSLQDFKDGGVDENYAFTCCASRFGLGGKPECKWTTGGLFKIGGVYVIRPDFHPVLAFAFADEEKNDEK